MNKKGIFVVNGKIRINNFFSENIGTKKTRQVIPNYRIIKSLSDYFTLLQNIHHDNELRLSKKNNSCGSLFLYRGQANVNWDYVPSILRDEKNIKREHLLQKEFHRRFFEIFDSCKTIFEEEVLMQHFGVGSRCLDLMENPLIALWAACYSENDKENKSFGEVSFWCLDNDDNNLKSYDSSTVSVISNIATLEPFFSLGQVEIGYHKEHSTEMTDFIYLKDVLRSSVVVRPKYNNQRIKNQQGCFAIVNLNTLTDEDRLFEKKFGISVKDFSDYILNAEEIHKNKTEEYRRPNVQRLKKNLHSLKGIDFSKLTSWDLWFTKQVPATSNFVDYFNLYKYQYNSQCLKTNELHPIYAIIPPDAKDNILKELKYLNITKAYIYPEMENVAKEMKETFFIS